MSLFTTNNFDDEKKKDKQSQSSGSGKQKSQKDTLVGNIFADKYEIISVIGAGGMSTVYKAKHKYMERIVAVKVLKKQLVSDPISVERFKKESKAASALSHPNIITVYDFGVDENKTAFLVMDYLEGTNLGDIIDNNGPLCENDVLYIFPQVARGLIHAHARNVIHRDLKPRNLVLTVEEDGSVLVQIVDFGIAKIVAQGSDQSSTLTRTGEVFGSPIYMSPEQCLSETLDVRSDIYSMGCVMYEALTGLPPFLGNNPMETMSMHVEDEPQPFSEVMPHNLISKKLEKIVFKCLEKEKEDRFESVQELLDAFPAFKEIPEESTSDGTHLLTLGQVVAGNSTKLNRALEKKPTKRRKLKPKANSNSYAIIFGVALFLVTSFICFYPGPDEDPGPPAFKMKWQLLMTMADFQIKNKQYANALPLLDWALTDAKNLSGKRKNYDKIFETLGKQFKVYSSLGMTAKQQDAANDYADLQKEKWKTRADKVIAELTAAKKYIEKLKAQNKDPRDYRSKEPLNIEGDSAAIIGIAKRLNLVKDYNTEEILLELADELYTVLYGKDYIELAEIKLQLADCLRKEDQIVEITNLRLYERVVEIQKHNLDALEKAPEDSAGYIQAVLKLGQWQRDRSNFDGARNNLTRAIELAQKSKVIKDDELTEFYNSYADFLRQVGNIDQAKEYEEKARNLKQKNKAGGDLNRAAQ